MNVVEALLEQALVTQKQLSEAQGKARSDGTRVDRALIQLGHIDEEQLLKVASEQLFIPFVDLANLRIPREAIDAMPIKLVHQKHLLPIARFNGSLKVATSDPFDLYAIDELRLLTGLEILPVLALEEQINTAIKTYYGLGGDTINQLIGDQDQLGIKIEEGAEDLMQMAQEASVIKLVNEIFLEAISERASDIHIEPYEHDLKVRYRIDGVLQDASVPAEVKRLQAAMISRIKIMAHLNIAEKRLPQDGRIKLRLSAEGRAKEIDFRVSCLPTLFGEKIVMRLLDQSKLMLDMTKLGFETGSLDRFESAIAKPWGLVLVTGPTGSGKTNTLYSAISKINLPGTNIMTAEDPVEFNLTGVNQVQMRENIGLNFAAALRSFLRQDPNIILVGEIRDFETAEIAVKAALTGHLVLSTLHTNDAPSTVNRLMNMGIEPFLVASAVNLICAQRLVRCVCENCAEDLPTPPPALEEIGFDAEQAATVMPRRGVGCERCRETGYKGRVGLYEVLEMTNDLREMILMGSSTIEIRQKAVEDGMLTLRTSGLHKIAAGQTTIEEVLKETVK